MSKILVTGSQGFVGQQLVPYLRQQGHSVVALDRAPGGDIHCDVDDVTIDDLIDIDQVIHLANTARIEPSWHHPDQYAYNNITVTTRFFRLCQLAGVDRFYYFSSSAVYGANETSSQTETDRLCPTNPYAITKQAAEQMLSALADSRHNATQLTVIRPFTMFGETMDTGPSGLAVGRFIQATVNGDSLTIQGTGQQTRDFLYIKDAVATVGKMVSSDHAGGIYNLGSGTTTSIQEIADVLSSRQIYLDSRPGMEYNTRANIKKIVQLGHLPTVGILEWLEQQKKTKFKEFICR